MSTWRNMVTREQRQGRDVYGVREVYFDSDGTIEGWTENTVQPFGETYAELAADVAHFVAAVESREVLDLTSDSPRIMHQGQPGEEKA